MPWRQKATPGSTNSRHKSRLTKALTVKAWQDSKKTKKKYISAKGVKEKIKEKEGKRTGTLGEWLGFKRNLLANKKIVTEEIKICKKKM